MKEEEEEEGFGGGNEIFKIRFGFPELSMEVGEA